MPSGHGLVSVASHQFQSQLPYLPNTQHQHNLRLTLNCLHCLKKRKTWKIPLKIPKGARITVAAALADIIQRGVVGYDQSLERLTSFATAALSTSSSLSPQSRQSLTAAMKTNIGQFADRLTSFVEDRVVLPKRSSRPPPCATDFRKMANSKLLVGDVTAAVRIIASDDSVITPTSEVVTALRLKHPPSPLDLSPPPTEPVSQTSSVSEEEVMVTLKSFRPSSADGVDGLRLGHLKDLVAPQTAEAGRRLQLALANLCSKLLQGQIPQHARDLLFAANLTALRKKDGGVRPIAVGNVIRRLASKMAAKCVIPELRRQLPPVQLGVGVSSGCEAAAHHVRAFVQSPVMPGNNVLVKLDMKNAFNTVRQDHFLEVCSSRAPSILRLASTAYATSSHLVIGNETILSETGVQHGDPLGPVMFALAVPKKSEWKLPLHGRITYRHCPQPKLYLLVKHHILAIDEASQQQQIARSVRSHINIWHLDDATISGPVESVCEDLRRIITMLSDIGLEVNPTKL